MNGPGTCVDCGNDAYIKLAGKDEEMVCAQCFALRARRDAAVSAPPPPARKPVEQTFLSRH